MAENNKTIERKDYNFKCGITAYQEECNYSQDKQILELLKSLKLQPKDLKDLTVEDIISQLTNNDNILQFICIILIPSGEYTEDAFVPSQLMFLKRSEIVEVLEDFFCLSPALKRLFGTGKFNLASLLGSSPQTKSSTAI